MKKTNEIEEHDRKYNDEEATVGMCENGGFLNEYNNRYAKIVGFRRAFGEYNSNYFVKWLGTLKGGLF